MSKNHRFIAIEGGDGAGKATQTALLKQRFEQEGIPVFAISFPRYGKPSSKIVEMYLNGRFGEAEAVPAELISLAYAVDRADASKEIQNALEEGKVVITDRYVASNLAHQGVKFLDDQKRHEFYELIKQYEFEVLGIAKPEINIVLTVPSGVAQGNIDNKATRSYTTQKRDVHEADAHHLERAKQNYIELCELYPNEFKRVECMENETTMRTREAIHEEIWRGIMS